MVASLKRRHFEIQETDVRRDYFEVVFTKEKDGICKERWHPAATFLPSVCPHSLWRKKLELQPISNQWFLKEDIGTRPGMDGFFDGSFTYLGWNLTKRLLQSPLTCVLRKPGSALEPLSISYRSSLVSWTQWLKLFFSVIYTMVGTKPRGSSKKYVAVEKQR